MRVVKSADRMLVRASWAREAPQLTIAMGMIVVVVAVSSLLIITFPDTRNGVRDILRQSSSSAAERGASGGLFVMVADGDGSFCEEKDERE